jgi:hypothetical protein
MKTKTKTSIYHRIFHFTYRIRKKWSKRSVNFKMQDVHKVIKMQDKLFVSSMIFEKLKGLPQA